MTTRPPTARLTTTRPGFIRANSVSRALAAVVDRWTLLILAAAFQGTKRFDGWRNGIVVLKFFLHVSKSEQKRRFMERLDNPEKNWKFSASDVAERGHWSRYQAAYEDAIGA